VLAASVLSPCVSRCLRAPPCTSPALSPDLTQEEAVDEMQQLKGKDRHAYDLWLDRRSFGGKGGWKYDAYTEEIEKRMVERGLTQEEAVD
jgi:hypothetical protein